MTDRKGVALIMVLFILVFLFLLGLAFRILTDQQYIFSSDSARKTELYYLAEAGVEYAVMQRAYWNAASFQDLSKEEKKFQLGSGWVEITDFVDSGSSIQVSSKGKFVDLDNPVLEATMRNNSVTITATIDRSGMVKKWEVQ